MPGIDGILEGFPDGCVQGKPGLDFMRGVLGASSHVKCLRLGELFLEAGLSAELVLDGGVVVDRPHLNERRAVASASASRVMPARTCAFLKLSAAAMARVLVPIFPIDCYT